LKIKRDKNNDFTKKNNSIGNGKTNSSMKLQKNAEEKKKNQINSNRHW